MVPRERLEGEQFPFLFGGTFIEGHVIHGVRNRGRNFPSFSEGLSLRAMFELAIATLPLDFPSFSEGLSLRVHRRNFLRVQICISLPFRRDFH